MMKAASTNLGDVIEGNKYKKVKIIRTCNLLYMVVKSVFVCVETGCKTVNEHIPQY